jgi:hypothetical protein
MKKSVILDVQQWTTLEAMMEGAIFDVQRSIEGVTAYGHDKAAEILKKKLAEYKILRDFLIQQRA